MSQFSKPWDELEFSDNYIFCKVMRNKDICIQMLEILLDIRIRDLVYIESEHPIQDFYETRGIRMDIYVKDSDKVFDIEMQTGNYRDLPLRSRYYLSASDISSTPRRTKFMDLNEAFIIFICKDDPFNLGLPVYTARPVLLEAPHYNYNDKTKKVFYNSSAFAKAENSELASVLRFIYTCKPDSDFTHKLEEHVELAKAEPIFKDEYMYFADILEDEKEQAEARGIQKGITEGFEKGIAEGIEKGITEGIQKGIQQGIEKGIQKGIAEGKSEANIENARALLKEGIPVETIARCIGLDLDKVLELQKGL